MRPGAPGDIKVFNLAQPAGRSVLLRLRKDADVVENYLRGCVRGLSYECMQIFWPLVDDRACD
jgi:crotonobetainyl-CoA:carnitine CoA-transferase CaiB-like acyl-CoA transferase